MKNASKSKTGQHTRHSCVGKGGMLGRQDSNLRMPDPKSGALPLGDSPMEMPL